MAAALDGFMVPELRREREASKLDIKELTTFIDGGEMVAEKRKKMCKSGSKLCAWCGCGYTGLYLFSDQLISDDPIFSLEDKYYLTTEEAFERAMEKSVHYVKLCKELNLDYVEKNLLKG